MNSRTLILLEYNRILEMLAEQAGSELTRTQIRLLKPMTHLHAIQDAQTETTEAVSVILYKGNIPIGDFPDLSSILKMARKGRVLSMRELLRVRSGLQIAREVKAFLTSDVPEIPVLTEIASLIETVDALEKDINRCILSEDEMADDASRELRQIRREIRNKNESIRARLSKTVNSTSSQKFLQEAIVTMRNGRYVIPVKREYANMFPGLVHDQSQSGSTLFIEPQSVVNMNNELRELAMAEQTEITRILQAFSGRVAEHFHGLNNNQKLLLELDLIGAKGKLSVQMNAYEPRINTSGILDIRGGRHPLIQADKVVPINVSLGRDWKTLLITGPNTGGKTVTLKTIGLFILMMQTGLHVPCREESELPVLEEVFADIGDEQSIEQNLSTFSAHMKNIKEIFENVNDSSLVLLDELGSGTDPAEGAALGIAELEELRKLGALVVATTHYTELKKYALTTPEVENASMEFNVETLSPTYRLRVGLPGKSNAFEISRKLGLDEGILQRAEALLDENELNFEDAVTRVEEERAHAEQVTEAVRLLREEAEEKLRIAEEQIRKAEREKEKILEQAEEEARRIIRETEETVEGIREDLKRMKDDSKGHQINKVAESRRKLREAGRRHQKEEEPSAKPQGVGVRADQLSIGTRVKLVTLDQNGEVVSLPDAKGNLMVQIGALKMNANVKNLMLIENEKAGNKERRRRQYNQIKTRKTQSIGMSINLIGKNLDDARVEMEKYLDDAYLAGLKSVTIVHGRGEGILKKGLRDALKHNRCVKSFKSAPYNQGGEGATVVELKE
jgi:DNA mismatch repair protein MutS2